MPTEWFVEEKVQQIKRWPRSWRQTFETGFGEAFTLTAHIEMLELDAEGGIEHKPLPSVTFSLDAMSQEELEDAAILEATLTRLIGRRVKAMLQGPTAETMSEGVAE